MPTINDYTFIEDYLVELRADIYAQPPDPGHAAKCQRVLDLWLPILAMPWGSTVADMGCGQGLAAEMFTNYGYEWTGVTLGDDYTACHAAGLNVRNADFTFTGFKDNAFDLVFARHALEHSPIPLLTLMEFHRIARHYVGVIVPSPEVEVLASRNHYCLLYKKQWEAYFYRAGFNIAFQSQDDLEKETGEYWYMLSKVNRATSPDYHSFLLPGLK